MSARASYYAKNLAVCPNGQMITPREKLVLIVLADSHQDKAKHFTYPSIDTIAADAMCDRRTCQRYLAALEKKGVIARLRPPNQGRGMQIFYFFSELDPIPEGWQPAALSPAKNSPHKGGERAAEGRQKGGTACIASITNINPNEELKTNTPLPPSLGEGEVSRGNEPALELTEEQQQHLARCRERGEDPERWERYYRETNAEHARQAKEREEVDRQAKLLFPNPRAAVEAVMRGCGFVNGERRNGLPAVLLQVLELQDGEGRPSWITGPKMICAWQLRKHKDGPRYGPLKFYRDGHWLEFVGEQ